VSIIVIDEDLMNNEVQNSLLRFMAAFLGFSAIVCIISYLSWYVSMFDIPYLCFRN